MGRGNDYMTRVVRLFSDHAASPMWFALGPVDYQDARLSGPLESGLRAWDALHYAGRDRGGDWSSPEADEEIVAVGQRLAQRLARELGSDFEVEVDSHPRRPETTRFHSHTVALNPEAAEAFHAMAEEAGSFG
jgi:hypothetical protein